MRGKAARHVLPIAILLLGMAVRLAPWGQNRFLEDEALYAYWGKQIATGADAMLDREPVDKPPLHAYTLALGFLAFSTEFVPVAAANEGNGAAELSSTETLDGAVSPEFDVESIARLPSLLASLTSIALVYVLGKRLYGDPAVGALAALLLALSPFDILFASTAFTDPLMTCLVLGALLAASAERPGTAGLLSALAAATKQQGLLFLPLVIGLAVVQQQDSGSSNTGASPAQPALSRKVAFLRKPWVRFALGFAVVALGVAAWDLAREQRPGFLEQSFISYGGLGPAQPSALSERLGAWLGLVQSFWVSAWFNATLVGAAVVWMCAELWQRQRGRSVRPADDQAVSRPPVLGTLRFNRTDMLLIAFVGGYLLLHWLVGFQVWDRYLLALVPLVALLGTRSVVALGRMIRKPAGRLAYALALALVLLVTLAGPVARAMDSGLPLGGDHGAYDGIDDLAGYVRAVTPHGAVLYHHWLGHHYRFYLHGEPLRLHWYPDLEDLIRDATIYRREPRFIAFPSWRDNRPAVSALAEAGIVVEPVFDAVRRDGSTSFRLYELQGPAVQK